MEKLVATNVSWGLTPNTIHMTLSTDEAPEPVSSAFAFITRESKRGTEMLLVDVISRGYDVPGGHREAGETVIEALEREVLEEAGLDKKFFLDVAPLGWLHISTEGERPEGYRYPYPDAFMAYYRIRVGNDFNLPGSSMADEIRGYRWVPIEQVAAVAGNRMWTAFLEGAV